MKTFHFFLQKKYSIKIYFRKSTLPILLLLIKFSLLMKNQIFLTLSVLFCMFLISSCEKEDPEVNVIVNVTLESNQAYTYQITKLGDKDDQIQITKEASHALISVCPYSQESELKCSLVRHSKSLKSAVCWCT